MPIQFSSDLADVDWEEAAGLISCTLARRDPAPLRLAFENSQAVVFAKDETRLVGMGRALDDGVFQAVLYDICLLPAYQSQGHGKALLNHLLARIKGANVLLYAVPGKEAFYERFGFRKMTTAMARFGDAERMVRLGYITPR
ncbi:GNAT family N-acetyltransferase [Paucidesulfovibrio longus]|uniref:GNAT family N-acetyltransferase n=1 Tax=Paucidesulfovibrio longus TaxID=889 RepID=UPI0003B2EC01|nr:GNAT family N-acetyltransferase [Paucidesulfovibrio longus]